MRLLRYARNDKLSINISFLSLRGTEAAWQSLLQKSVEKEKTHA